MTQPIRVLLVEDHKLVRAGFRALLQDLPGVEVVADTGDGHEALELIEELQPDVVLLDLTIPGLNGLEVLSRVAGSSRTRVVVVSIHSSPEYVTWALRAGAAGYVIKNSELIELDLAIRAATRGEVYLSPAVSKDVVSNYVQRHAEDTNPLDRLTPRQREVLQLLAESHTVKDIARKLNVSRKTVETHRALMMDRLGIHDIPGLVRYAIRARLLSADDPGSSGPEGPSGSFS